MLQESKEIKSGQINARLSIHRDVSPGSAAHTHTHTDEDAI